MVYTCGEVIFLKRLSIYGQMQHLISQWNEKSSKYKDGMHVVQDELPKEDIAMHCSRFYFKYIFYQCWQQPLNYRFSYVLKWDSISSSYNHTICISQYFSIC